MTPVTAEVRSAAILWKEDAERINPQTGETVAFKRRQRARKGAIVELPEGEFKRLQAIGDVQVPGAAPLPGSVVEATPNARPFNDGASTVSFGETSDKPRDDRAPEASEPAGVRTTEAGTFNSNTYVEALAKQISDENLNVGATVALAEGDPETAKLVLAAEHAADAEPRKGVIEKLQEIIDSAESSE